MQTINEKLIVALDVSTANDALRLVDTLGENVTFYKIGMQLYFAEGNDFVRNLKSRQKKVFLDLKINDIPETVAKAVLSVADLGVDYLTLFTNRSQLEAASTALAKNQSPLKLLNVTVLTSEASDATQVLSRAELSLAAGAHGLISSGQETKKLRERFGAAPIIVNPGIRPAGSDSNDQVRIVTPLMAIQSGATNIVVGRPITQAPNPRAVAESILDEIARA